MDFEGHRIDILTHRRLSYLICLCGVFTALSTFAAEPGEGGDQDRQAYRSRNPVSGQPWYVPPYRQRVDQYIDRRFDDLHRRSGARRVAREQELVRKRRQREAERRARRERWDEERRQAREAVLEQERHYREEQLERIPVLQGYRRRNAEELERRRQASERRRRARWEVLDKRWEDE